MGGCQPTAIHKRRAATTGSHTGNGGTAISGDAAGGDGGNAQAWSTSSDGSNVEPLYLGLCADDADFNCGKHEVDGDCAGTCVGPIPGDCTGFCFGKVEGICTGVCVSWYGGHGGHGGHDGDWNGGGGWNHGGNGGWWPEKGWSGGSSYAPSGKGGSSVQASIKALPTTGAGNSTGDTNELMLLGVVGLLGLAGIGLRKKVA